MYRYQERLCRNLKPDLYWVRTMVSLTRNSTSTKQCFLENLESIFGMRQRQTSEYDLRHFLQHEWGTFYLDLKICCHQRVFRAIKQWPRAAVFITLLLCHFKYAGRGGSSVVVCGGVFAQGYRGSVAPLQWPRLGTATSR